MSSFAQAICLLSLNSLFTRQQCLFGWQVEGLFVSVGLSHSVEITAWSDGHRAEGFCLSSVAQGQNVPCPNVQ